MQRERAGFKGRGVEERQAPETTSYVTLAVEMITELDGATWSTNGLHPVSNGVAPVNRAWYQPDTLQGKGFFRLRGLLSDWP